MPLLVSLARLTLRIQWVHAGSLTAALVVPRRNEQPRDRILREPTPLLRQAVRCAAVGVRLMLTSMVIITVPLSSLTPTVGVMLPVALLIPVAAWRMSAMKT